MNSLKVVLKEPITILFSFFLLFKISPQLTLFTLLVLPLTGGVLAEIIKRLKLNTKIKFVPWPRARFEAETKDNIFLIPLARTPEREQNYAWIIHVLDDPYVLVALKKTKFDISTHEAAKKLKIGVLKKSVD